jgi:uncharacterized protein YdiU (UPF0061 family)
VKRHLIVKTTWQCPTINCYRQVSVVTRNTIEEYEIICFVDDNGRYAYQKQPEICKWNCKKFAEAIQMALPLARTEPELQRIFDGAYQPHYNTKMRRKVNT